MLCHYKGTVERRPSSYSLWWQEGQSSFVFLKAALWLDWLEETWNQNTTDFKNNLVWYVANKDQYSVAQAILLHAGK